MIQTGVEFKCRRKMLGVLDSTHSESFRPSSEVDQMLERRSEVDSMPDKKEVRSALDPTNASLRLEEA